MKWHKYADDDCITYPNKEGYYWVVLKAEGKRGVMLAYWRNLDWWVSDIIITIDVEMWANKTFTRPKLPKDVFYKGGAKCHFQI